MANFAINFKTLERLLREAIEIGFTICNESLEEYGMCKVIDIIHQILPTALILNTSFWVYYSSSSGHCLCICCRYGIRCIHIKSLHHWVNLWPVRELYGMFPKTESMNVVPFNVSISMTPVNALNCVDVDVQFSIALDGTDDLPGNCLSSTYNTRIRFEIIPQLIPVAPQDVSFKPNPISCYSHTSMLTDLTKDYSFMTRNGCYQLYKPSEFAVMYREMPNFSLRLLNFVISASVPSNVEAELVNSLPTIAQPEEVKKTASVNSVGTQTVPAIRKNRTVQTISERRPSIPLQNLRCTYLGKMMCKYDGGYSPSGNQQRPKTYCLEARATIKRIEEVVVSSCEDCFASNKISDVSDDDNEPLEVVPEHQYIEPSNSTNISSYLEECPYEQYSDTAKVIPEDTTTTPDEIEEITSCFNKTETSYETPSTSSDDYGIRDNLEECELFQVLRAVIEERQIQEKEIKDVPSYAAVLKGNFKA